MNILEQIQMEDFLSGKESFRIFLYLINKFELRFLKKNYLNTGNYYYFFYTESIPDNEMLKDELELKESLKAGYLTFKKMKKDRKISFYFGIYNHILEYGFYDLSRKVVYKIGKFEIEDNYFKNLPRHKCFKGIRDRLEEANLKNMELLHKIKEDFKNFMEKGNIKILNEYKIKFFINKNNVDNLNEKKLTQKINKFKEDYEWGNLVTSFTIIGEKMIHFYLRLKSKEVVDLGY